MSIKPNPLSILYSTVTFSWLQQNAFSSVHVIINCFIGFILAGEIPGLKYLFFIGAGLVFFATFLTKQHFIADSIAGLLLAIIGYWFWLKQVRIND